MSCKTIGRRVYPNDAGYLPSAINNPASYGRATASRTQNTRLSWWQITAPDGSLCSLNPEIHVVTEHEDGTITVEPSIDLSYRSPPGWHGHLTRGLFIAAT